VGVAVGLGGRPSSSGEARRRRGLRGHATVVSQCEWPCSVVAGSQFEQLHVLLVVNCVRRSWTVYTHYRHQKLWCAGSSGRQLQSLQDIAETTTTTSATIAARLQVCVRVSVCMV